LEAMTILDSIITWDTGISSLRISFFASSSRLVV
jgi:hypothetical protein